MTDNCSDFISEKNYFIMSLLLMKYNFLPLS